LTSSGPGVEVMATSAGGAVGSTRRLAAGSRTSPLMALLLAQNGFKSGMNVNRSTLMARPKIIPAPRIKTHLAQRAAASP
jgi:hypothetical protein